MLKMDYCMSLKCYFLCDCECKPRSWFQGQPGVRLGDPLSRFLFTIVVDVFSPMLSRAMDRDLI